MDLNSWFKPSNSISSKPLKFTKTTVISRNDPPSSSPISVWSCKFFGKYRFISSRIIRSPPSSEGNETGKRGNGGGNASQFNEINRRSLWPSIFCVRTPCKSVILNEFCGLSWLFSSSLSSSLPCNLDSTFSSVIISSLNLALSLLPRRKL